MQNSDLDFNFKHPVLLPHRHSVTDLYVKKCHFQYGHFGPNLVFGVLLQDFGLWPIGGANTVRHYTKNCLGCMVRRQARGEQMMAPLPSARFKPRLNVFTYVASDLAGPFGVTIGRSVVKRWLCVFVCMTTTAISIEVAADLSTSSFMNTFRRFLCSSGFRTRFIRTDNGSNFIGANNLLKAEMKAALADIGRSKCFQQHLQDWDLEWEFGQPKASHHGGLYERKIRTIRKAIGGLEKAP